MNNTIPIKLLKDEDTNSFFPVTVTSALVDPQGRDLSNILNSKLELSNILQGTGITLTKDTINNTITIASNSASLNLIDNLTTTTAEQGALDAHQGYVLKGLIDAVPVVDVIDNLTTVDGTKALSAYQGYLLNNRTVPAGGTTGQVLKKSSNADNAVEWGDAADPNAISGDGSIKEIVELTYAEYKALSTIDPDTEYHISDLEGGTSTYIKTEEIQDMIDDSIDAIGLKTVATTGSYNDLSNKPTIPTITDIYSSTSSNGMSGKAVASAISTIGTVEEVTFNNITVTSGTTVATISLEAGVWIIVAHAQWQGQDIRWYMSIGGNSCSAYDNNGWVDALCTTIVSHNTTTSYSAQMWNMNPDGTGASLQWSGNIRAVRIK